MRTAKKHLLVTALFIFYGVISIPVNWLQGYTDYDFKTLTALNIIFSISTNISVALLNIYIPYCMQRAGPESAGPETRAREGMYKTQHVRLWSLYRISFCLSNSCADRAHFF
jgi:hypothetical protein